MLPNAAPRDPESPLEEGYRLRGSGHDELLAGGQVRQAWRPTMGVLNRLGAAEIRQRVAASERLIRDFGVSYNIYDNMDVDDVEQGWAMDLVPFVLDGKEWEFLETALGQRLRLLNLLLADCYGAQTLLNGHLLPPPLVLGNPAFLTAAHRLLPEKHKHLQFYAADLARSAKGSWWVLSDRLDAPSGLGYALENRTLSHRLLPEGLREQPVHSLQPFISAFSETVARLAPRDVDDPHIVLLTPGPHNETYFEHSFLARTLGFPLVEGNDLTVRDGRVFLKTISGMRQVDVIVRRLDSEWCDPLELRSDSLLGIPGLLQAVRGGHVAVANGIGSGLMQSPAITAFLPNLCRRLLGENLMLPSVATWWCGQEKELKYVLDNLASLVIKSAKTPGAAPAVIASELSAQELATWRDRIRRNPHEWCAQELVNKATTPALRDGKLIPSHFLMRVFLVRHEGRYLMMPGGMARVAPASGVSVSMQAGAVSKDVWVVGQKVPMPRSDGNRISSAPVLLRRAGHSLPSRTADNLFWLGRYFERVEFKARIVRALIDALMDETAHSSIESVPLLLSALVPDEELVDLSSRERTTLDLAACEKVLARWFRAKIPGGGLREDALAAIRIARSVKERLSLETWNAASAVERVGNGLIPPLGQVISNGTLQALDSAITLLSSVSGLFMENMTRGDAWLFQDLGRRIERCSQLSNLLYSTLTPPCGDERFLLRLLLLCADSLITYRRRYFTHLHPVAVIDLLLFDACNPRSMAFQIDLISRHLRDLPHGQIQRARPFHMDQTALKLAGQIGLGDPTELERRGRGQREALALHLDETAMHLCALSEQIGDHYFAITRQQAIGNREQSSSVLEQQF